MDAINISNSNLQSCQFNREMSRTRQSDGESSDIDIQASQRDDVDKAELEKKIEELDKNLSLFTKGFKFAVHEETGKLIVQIIDKKSDRVVVEIPPSEALDMEARFEKFLGILFDKKI